MQHHNNLFKEQSLVLSPRNHIELNRERKRVARTKQRNDNFHRNRVISIGPTPQKIEPLTQIEKETLPRHSCIRLPSAKTDLDIGATSEVLEASSSSMNSNVGNENETPAGDIKKKLTRQEMYLQRYLKWKEAKRDKERKSQPEQRASSTVGTSFPYESRVFRPPESIKHYAPKEESPNSPPKRRSIYLLVDGKGKAQKLPADKTGAATTTKPMPKPLQQRIQSATIKTETAKSVVTTKTLPKIVQVKPMKPLPTAVQPSGSANGHDLAKNKELAPSAPEPMRHAQTAKPQLPNIVTQPFKKPAVGTQVLARGGGAVSKFKPTKTEKRPAAGTPRAKATQLSMRMKAKKPAPISQKCKLSLMEELVAPPDTPLELNCKEVNFQARATSTQLKSNNNSAHLFDVYGDITSISPVAVNKRLLSNGSSAKRQLLPTQESELKKKFNFVRYSVDPVVLESPTIEEATLQPQSSVESGTANEENITLLPHTPCEPNYLSPFVSVSRGKVNSRAEREKRNSMYLQDQEKAQPETPVALRRTLETVSYFRLQLSNETERLHKLCGDWEAYQSAHEARLLESGGIDMINVAIGQTKLLTSKKLMQFKSLIDRCEAGATGVGAMPDDGSEDTKPVQVEDLEGWWDMVRLQSENVDKRFENLERWKTNDWLDPDAATHLAAANPKAKIIKNSNIRSKVTVKPNSNLKQFLRKALAERKKEAAAKTQATKNATETRVEAEAVVATPMLSSKRRSSTHRVIVVRDRRSFSPARTVLRVSKGARPSGTYDLLKSAIKGAAEQKRRSIESPKGSGSMPVSILKTPGTAKRSLHGVVFSAKKKVRRFQFTFDEGAELISDDDGAAAGTEQVEDIEEDMSSESSLPRNAVEKVLGQNAEATLVDDDISRAYTLRNRRVKLRPSYELI